jgi:hypothetical protein
VVKKILLPLIIFDFKNINLIKVFEHETDRNRSLIIFIVEEDLLQIKQRVKGKDFSMALIAEYDLINKKMCKIFNKEKNYTFIIFFIAPTFLGVLFAVTLIFSISCGQILSNCILIILGIMVIVCFYTNIIIFKILKLRFKHIENREDKDRDENEE